MQVLFNRVLKKWGINIYTVTLSSFSNVWKYGCLISWNINFGIFIYIYIFLALITHLILVFYVLHLINQTEINDISFTFYYWNYTFSVLFPKHTRTLSVSHVYLFSKKCPKVPSKVEGAALIGGGRLKKGRTYFKFRGIFHMKFWNLIIVSFQVTIHNYCRALKQKGSIQIL